MSSEAATKPAKVKKRFQALRKERGLSLRDLAKKTGISRQTVLRVEGCQAKLSTAKKVIEALVAGAEAQQALFMKYVMAASSIA